MAKQLDMNLNDPKHPVWTAGKRYLDIVDQIRELTDKKANAAEELAQVMEDNKRFSITINGTTLSHRKREESRGIQIMRPR